MPIPLGRRAFATLARLWSSLVLAACSAPVGRLGPVAAGHPLIAEVFATGLNVGGADQYICLYNPLKEPIDLSAWSLGHVRARGVFPEGARIGPGQTFYAARSTDGFQKTMGFPPDAVWGGGPAGEAMRMNGAATLMMQREAGLVVLRDPTGQAVDQVAWGIPPEVAVGWQGSPVPAPGASEVLDRARDEFGWSSRAPGPYMPDTDTAADWQQGTEWIDRRVLRPGQTFFPYPTFTVQGVTAYSSPDSSYAVMVGLFDGARRSIDVNIYAFTNIHLARKLANAARRGVTVRVLFEASSLGALEDTERLVAQVIHEAGGQVRWMVNQPGAGIYGRYVYNHAKYGVIDGTRIFVQSENMGPTGVPVDNAAGNRGWGVEIHSEALAEYMGRVFEADWNPNHSDVFPFMEGTPFGPPPPGTAPEPDLPPGNYPHPFPALTVTDPVRVTPVLAPDHALLETLGIFDLIRSACRSILVEQLYIQVHCAVFTTGYKQLLAGFLAIAHPFGAFHCAECTTDLCALWAAFLCA